MHHAPNADNLVEAALSRPLLQDELESVITYVAAAEFSSAAQERVRGRLSGMIWRGRRLTGSDTLPPAMVHYLWHVLRRRKWPDGADLTDYVESLRRVVLDPDSGVLVGRYQGVVQLGAARQSRELRGPNGHDWVVVQYRVGYGFWVTGYQPEAGLREFEKPQWSDVRWLRQPRHSSA